MGKRGIVVPCTRRTRRASLADQAPDTEAAQRILNLLYLIRVTEKPGEDILFQDFVAGYNHARSISSSL